MIDSIHQSSLGMALRCGEQFRRRYIEGEVIPPSIAAARGTGVHRANKINLTQKVHTTTDLPLADLQDAARDGFVHALQSGVYMPKEDFPAKARLINEGLEDSIRCTRLYHQAVAPTIQPVAVEEPFKFDIGLELPLAGTIDYATEPVLGDLKTSSTKWPEGRAKTEIQPVFYSLAYERTQGTRPRFQYNILIARRGKTGPTSEELQNEWVDVQDRDYQALFAKLALFMSMLKAGVFPPANPTSWWCSEKWCGYWQTCPYVGNSKSQKWV